MRVLPAGNLRVFLAVFVLSLVACLGAALLMGGCESSAKQAQRAAVSAADTVAVVGQDLQAAAEANTEQRQAWDAVAAAPAVEAAPPEVQAAVDAGVRANERTAAAIASASGRVDKVSASVRAVLLALPLLQDRVSPWLKALQALGWVAGGAAVVAVMVYAGPALARLLGWIPAPTRVSAKLTSEALAIADVDPTKAVEKMRQAVAVDRGSDPAFDRAMKKTLPAAKQDAAKRVLDRGAVVKGVA